MKKSSPNANQPQIISITTAGLTWTDISFPSAQEIAYLGQTYHFHHLSLEDSLSRTRLSKVDDYGSYLFLVLHFPKTAPDEMVIRSTSFSAFIGSNYVITLHDELKPLSELFDQCKADEEIRQQHFTDGAGYLVYRIIDHLVNHSFPILEKLLARMNDIEDTVFDETGDDTQEIATLRRDIIMLRSIIWPSRSVINELKERVRPYSHRDLGIYFESVIDHINKIWETLEESKEVIEVYKDSDFVLVSSRLNRIVQTLTIISAVFLPFVVVASVYGMNVNLPGGIEKGSLASFGILLGVMFIISGSMLYFFRRRHWI
jgi:magnesium transporter